MGGQNQSDNAEWPLVLVCEDSRVEIHLLPLDEERHVLVALAGEGSRPARIKGQGPFPDPDVAVAVARRIGQTLASRGYRRADHVRWQMDAWRHRRQVLQERAKTPLRKDFHPDDVLR